VSTFIFSVWSSCHSTTASVVSGFASKSVNYICPNLLRRHPPRPPFLPGRP
jgi:hypothetical protein